MSGAGKWQLPGHLAELTDMGGEDVIAEILTIFLEDTPVRVERIASVMRTGDALQVSREGHGLKSGCLQIGADSLASLAAELEHGAPPERWQELLGRIQDEYAAVAAQIRAR